jgi:undecaprenyl-diphosphatase
VIRRRSDVVVLCVSLAVLVPSTLALGSTDRVPAFERAVFFAINDLPDWIAWVVIPIMQLGSLWAGAVIALALALWNRRAAAASVFIASFGAWLIARLGKQLIGRQRPGLLLSDVHIRGATASGLGFPSGHAAVSMAIALAILPYLGSRYRYAILLLPLIVGFARIYVGAHLPLDVVAGWAIGAASASLTHLVFGVPVSAASRSDRLKPSHR